MPKDLTYHEYEHWKLNKMLESCRGTCSICGNQCEKCIMFYIGLHDRWMIECIGNFCS